MLNFIKAVLYGVIEGITEWLPISSTGHMILAEQFLQFDLSDEFLSMFRVVIQLGAILAVVVLYFHKLNPFSPGKSGEEKKQTWSLWAKVILAILPSGLVGVLFDDWMDAHLHTSTVVAAMLILYGIAFILVEKAYQGRHTIQDVNAIDYKTALGIGLFQCLAMVPGVSRSGATIAGGLLLGTDKRSAAEFSFFLALPTMFGATCLETYKLIAHGEGNILLEGNNLTLLLLGSVVAYVVAIAAIKFFISYVTRYGFKAFGWYRIVAGALILLLMACGVDLAMVD